MSLEASIRLTQGPLDLDMELAIGEDEVVALLGPNGAGKTTTMHMLLGLTLPTTGTITIGGRDLVHDRSRALARTNFTASYVQLSWRLRVRELLRVYCELYEVDDPAAAIEDVADLLDLHRHLDRTLDGPVGNTLLDRLRPANVQGDRVPGRPGLTGGLEVGDSLLELGPQRTDLIERGRLE